MKTVSIIGFGRFGKTLYRLLSDDFDITLYNRSGIDSSTLLKNNTRIAKDLQDAYTSETIFYAVPISAFAQVLKKHKAYFRDDQVLIDVLSVKMYPQQVFNAVLKNRKTQALLTHPMFGPDSSKEGFNNLPLIINKFKANDETYKFWKNYFQIKKLRVIEMTPLEHDKLAAKSQGLTHFIGRLLEKVHFQPTIIDSLGSKKLQEIEEQTCNDTWELFHDLQTYNPFTKKMRIQLGKAYSDLYDKLLPARVNPNYYIYGIQGGAGSFNEQAIRHYIQRENIKKYKIKYLYTTEKVLNNLHAGNIDFGQFAITNSTGGLVEESMQAMAKYNYTVVDDFEILIQHFLMKRKDATEGDIDTIMAHPQVLKQCEQTLKNSYKHLTLKSGSGDMVDTARAAESLDKGKLPKNIAILGPRILSEKYDFDIMAENLQDKKDNFTRFLLVRR